MSYKSSQLFPLSTHATNLRICTQSVASWPNLDNRKGEFLRSWLIYDPELDVARRMDRYVMLGMALVVTLSASFWAGLGLAIVRVWK